MIRKIVNPSLLFGSALLMPYQSGCSWHEPVDMVGLATLVQGEGGEVRGRELFPCSSELYSWTEQYVDNGNSTKDAGDSLVALFEGATSDGPFRKEFRNKGIDSSWEEVSVVLVDSGSQEIISFLPSGNEQEELNYHILPPFYEAMRR